MFPHSLISFHVIDYNYVLSPSDIFVEDDSQIYLKIKIDIKNAISRYRKKHSTYTSTYMSCKETYCK